MPTYNRHDLLKQALDSVVSQKFTDFEIIVGNDYTSELLTAEQLGFSDPRIRIINHPCNLREVGNMNSLLTEAKGRYFTWLFDDDLFVPGYLQTAHGILTQSAFPHALFSSYHVIDDNHKELNAPPATGRLKQFSSVEFLTEYCAGHLAIISTTGIFDTVALKNNVGGVEELCDSPIGLYCEYLFLVRCAALNSIVYIDTPLVVFRAHVDSWGGSNMDLCIYPSAGQNLLRRSGDVLNHTGLIDIAAPVLLGLSKIHLHSYADKLVAYETRRNCYGISAKYRALKQFTSEAAAIRTVCSTLLGYWNTAVAFRFLLILVYCYRFILGKFRIYRREKSSWVS